MQFAVGHVTGCAQYQPWCVWHMTCKVWLSILSWHGPLNISSGKYSNRYLKQYNGADMCKGMWFRIYKIHLIDRDVSWSTRCTFHVENSISHAVLRGNKTLTLCVHSVWVTIRNYVHFFGFHVTLLMILASFLEASKSNLQWLCLLIMLAILHAFNLSHKCIRNILIWFYVKVKIWKFENVHIDTMHLLKRLLQLSLR